LSASHSPLPDPIRRSVPASTHNKQPPDGCLQRLPTRFRPVFRPYLRLPRDASNSRLCATETGKVQVMTRTQARPMSPARRYPPPMIDLGTLAGLHDYGHELHAYCLHCDRWPRAGDSRSGTGVRASRAGVARCPRRHAMRTRLRGRRRSVHLPALAARARPSAA
jgi:hypothetical protein